MAVRRFLFAAAFLILVLAVAASVNAASPSRKIVVFAPNVGAAAQEATVRDAGGRPVKPVPLVNAVVAELSAGAAEALSHRPGVVRIEEDVIVQASEPGAPTDVRGLSSSQAPGRTKKSTPTPTPSLVPSPTPSVVPSPSPTPSPTPTSAPTSTATPVPSPTPGTSTQTTPWGVSKINAPQAWAFSRGDGVKVGIIDTGISLSHPDLTVAGGVSEVAYTTSYNDDDGHGSHVAGIIAARDNGSGVVGVAPNASLYAIKVLDNTGSGYISDIINGLGWAMSNGIQVANMSLGTSSDIQSFHDAITKAFNSGIVLVAAAGNSGPSSNTVNYPAAYPEVIAVSAIDSKGAIASFSSNGPQVDLAAPGVNIYSTYMGTGYATMSGTSMASPHVAGVAALRKKLHPSETPSQVAAALEANADLLAGLTQYQQGSGMVDAYKAVTAP